jgi:hypothetical protein
MVGRVESIKISGDQYQHITFPYKKKLGMIFIFILIVIACELYVISCTRDQCIIDCRLSEPNRLVGPTRPWYIKDEMGNELLLTRPYPYTTAGSVLNVSSFNITIEYHGFPSSNEDMIKKQVDTFIVAVKNALYSSYHLDQSHQFGNEENGSLSITIRITQFDGSCSVNGGFVDSIRRNISNVMNESNFEYEGEINVSNISHYRTLGIENPNSYSKFCEYGCAIFYASPSDPMYLSECMDKCDNYYNYNLTVGYNDYIEVARSECRDGCQIALRRCKPGYYCTKDGFMAHCPVGSFRDVDYHAVETCNPCPPGRFRDDVRGKALNDCTKCPPGTYNDRNGSSSIQDCKRCPAGTFTSGPGSEYCICITPAACEKDQYPSPGDAEKRDTIPYIGRW